MTGGKTLRRLRAFVWVVGVVGLVQAVGAVVAARSIEDPTSAAAQLGVAVGVGLVGASTVAARTRFVRRPWRVDDATALALDYSTRVVVQVILALGAANVAYAGAIITGAGWIIAIGLVFFVAPLVAAVPSTRNLARVEAELEAQGSRFRLLESLQSRDTV
jgi:hypothetical protein